MLESYPRDELFQIAVPIAAQACRGDPRPRRAAARAGARTASTSSTVSSPSSSSCRATAMIPSSARRSAHYLKTVFEGRLSAYYPAFPEGGLARVHFIIGRSGGKTPKVEQAAIEAAIRDIIRTWEDALREAAAASGADAVAARRSPRGFPKAIAAPSRAAEALADARRIAGAQRRAADRHRLLPARRPDAAAGGAEDLPPRQAGGAFAARAGTRKHRLQGHQRAHLRGRRRCRRRAGLHPRHGARKRFRRSRSTWPTAASCSRKCSCRSGGGEADNDGYNALAQTAGLRSRGDRHPARLWPLSAAGRHPAKPGFHRRRAQPLSGDRARRCHGLFVARLDPAAGKEGEVTAKHLKAKIKDALEDVPNIDDDTIIRRYLNLIEASLRTNHFAPGT